MLTCVGHRSRKLAVSAILLVLDFTAVYIGPSVHRAVHTRFPFQERIRLSGHTPVRHECEILAPNPMQPVIQYGTERLSRSPNLRCSKLLLTFPSKSGVYGFDAKPAAGMLQKFNIAL